MSSTGMTGAQRRIARTVLAVAGTDGFHLAGGAALVASNITDRPARDISVSTAEDVDVGRAAERVAVALRDEGFEVDETRRLSRRATLVVTAVGPRRSTFLVDLVHDAIAWPGETTSLGPTLSPRELAANKVLALFDRVQTRDLADLAVLAEQFPLEDMLADAEAKEPAFSRRLLAEWVRKVIASPAAEWPEGADVEALRRFGAELAASLEQG